MDKKQAKEYILKHWKVSSGKRITKMLLRYWKLKKTGGDSLIQFAKKLFK